MELSTLLSDGVILQRNEEISLYGFVSNTTETTDILITIEFAGQKKSCRPSLDGSFEAVFPPMKEGGPYTITVSCFSGNKEYEAPILVNDVMIGDVWLLGGQSNMELSIARTLDNYADEVKNANNPYIRMFQVPQEYNFHGPVERLNGGKWETVTPETVYKFSGIGYFFAVRDYEMNRVPIGLLHTAMGGAHIEAYIGEERIAKVGSFLRIRAKQIQEDMLCTCDKNDSCKFCYDELLIKDRNDEMIRDTIENELEEQLEWIQKLDKMDIGLLEHWYDKEWDEVEDDITGEIEVPKMWNHMKLGSIRGSIWLQFSVFVPEEWINKEVQLRLGSLVDSDITYINGIEVGRTEYRYPPRRYWIDKGILVAGKNVITVRLVASSNVGGFKEDMPYCLKLGKEEIDLKGKWRFRIGAKTEELGQPTFFQWRPCGLFNGMMYPLHHLKLKGFLFYQGESNSAHPKDYEYLFKIMIEEWRGLFGQHDIPFVYAQLPDFMGEGSEIGTDRWDWLRRSQKKVLDMPYTAMAVLYDLGQYNELHPQNKKEVAERLYEAYLRCK